MVWEREKTSMLILISLKVRVWERKNEITEIKPCGGILKSKEPLKGPLEVGKQCRVG